MYYSISQSNCEKTVPGYSYYHAESRGSHYSNRNRAVKTTLRWNCAKYRNKGNIKIMRRLQEMNNNSVVELEDRYVIKLFESTHEILALFVPRKFILQTCIRSHPVGLDVWFLVGSFVYFHSSCVRTAKALARAFAGRLCDKYHSLMSWL